MIPQPTRRAVIDIGRKCNVNCKFCYYHHLGDLRKQPFHPVDFLERKIDLALSRGNDTIDFTGGEPTLLPELPHLVKYAKILGIKSCVITNGLCGDAVLDRLQEAEVSDFLISIHGTKSTHDDVVREGAFDQQSAFIDKVKSRGIPFRANCVLNKINQNEIDTIADILIEYRPSIVNFINMNPHGDWSSDIDGTKNVIADLSIVHEALDRAIPKLEKNLIGVNLRYYPMCRISEPFRRCVCNDYHVVFDPYEWDYEILVKDYAHFRQWGVHTSNCMECKGKPCAGCDLQFICGGINNSFLRAAGSKCVNPVTDSGINDTYDFYHYRKHNTMTIGGVV